MGKATVCGTVDSLFKSEYSPYYILLPIFCKARVVKLVKTLISCIKDENSNFSSGFLQLK